MLKYSRQRSAIKKYLDSTKEHPTADMVYSKVREEFPNISLGTVYRNLSLLTEMGEILKITTPDGGDRYDGCVTPHYHVVCTTCGSVYDLDIPSWKMKEMNDLADSLFPGKVNYHTTLFYGICDDCVSKK